MNAIELELLEFVLEDGRLMVADTQGFFTVGSPSREIIISDSEPGKQTQYKQALRNLCNNKYLIKKSESIYELTPKGSELAKTSKTKKK